MGVHGNMTTGSSYVLEYAEAFNSIQVGFVFVLLYGHGRSRTGISSSSRHVVGAVRWLVRIELLRADPGWRREVCIGPIRQAIRYYVTETMLSPAEACN